MSQATTIDPHVNLEDGSGIEFRLDGERMDFQDAHRDGVWVEAEIADGLLIVSFSSDGLGVELIDEEASETIEFIDVTMVDESDERKVFEPAEDEEYSFQIEAVRGNAAK